MEYAKTLPITETLEIRLWIILIPHGCTLLTISEVLTINYLKGVNKAGDSRYRSGLTLRVGDIINFQFSPKDHILIAYNHEISIPIDVDFTLGDELYFFGAFKDACAQVINYG